MHFRALTKVYALKDSKNLIWATDTSSSQRVDKIGVNNANFESMQLALSRIERKIMKRLSTPGALQLLVDGDRNPELRTSTLKIERCIPVPSGAACL